MSPDRWQELKVLFDAALQRAPHEREKFLDEVCANDLSLRRQVETLLVSFDEAEDFIEQPAVEKVAELIIEKQKAFDKGQNIAHYKILSTLGVGGQGAVYKALDTKLGRTIALKTLPTELTVDETSLKRFKREAQIASSLDHPNICTVHDLTDVDGAHFIVMQFVDGKNVRELVSGHPLELKSTLKIAIQVCDALAAAHAQGVIHRDIKAHNIIVTENGQAKILDFGLAKFTRQRANGKEQTELTALGSPYGTPTYAAPEQSRGEKVDHRADIFSTGVLLYEMLTGTWPFQGETVVDVRHAVLYEEPKPIAERRGDAIPEKLEKIIAKALSKEPDLRFKHIAQMRDELIDVMRGLPDADMSENARFLDNFKSVAPRRVGEWSKQKKITVAVALVLIAIFLSAGGWLYWRNSNLKWARVNVNRVEELAKERKYFEAYDLAVQVKKYLPDDPTIKKLMPEIADTLTVTTEPAGASVYLKRFSPDANGQFPQRELAGVTPITNLTIARGDYILSVEKEGFAAFTRTISGMPENFGVKSFTTPPIELKLKLIEAANVPERMVYITGGDYQLVSWEKPTDATVKLKDFLIDKYEVSNREYKEFITAGGYLKKQFWKYPFVKDGRTLSFEEATNEFTDKTGLPAPRSWTNQNYAEGKADFPVTDITWYEAAAYAEFRNKRLPTVFEWEKTARSGNFTHGIEEVLPWGYFQKGNAMNYRANFAGKEAQAVDSNEFGVSPFGAYNMAGNVAEWCLNETTEGFIAAGGSYADPPYLFGHLGSFPQFYNSNKTGFRCVKDVSSNADEQGGAKIETAKEIPVYKPASEADYRLWLNHYGYDKTPVEAQVIEVKETEAWQREKITFLGANDERAIAYLYLPKNYQRPLQVIQYVPAYDVFGRYISLPEHIEAFLEPYIKSGRAVFSVVLKDFIERERPAGYKEPPIDSMRYREKFINWTTDLRRGLDYLETRKDIDMSRLAFWGYSAGAECGLVVTAVESRYRSIVFMSAGIEQAWRRMIPEANKIYFASQIKPPKLMLNGRYDEAFSFKRQVEPLYKLLREPKRLALYDGGHTPTFEVATPIINKWLDETLGAVRRE